MSDEDIQAILDEYQITYYKYKSALHRQISHEQFLVYFHNQSWLKRLLYGNKMIVTHFRRTHIKHGKEKY